MAWEHVPSGLAVLFAIATILSMVGALVTSSFTIVAIILDNHKLSVVLVRYAVILISCAVLFVGILVTISVVFLG